MNKFRILLVIFVSALLVTSCNFWWEENNVANTTEKITDETKTTKEINSQKTENKEEIKEAPKSDEIKNKKYIDYKSELLKQAISEKKDIALFFHASWCPSCRVLDKNIKDNLNKIPANLQIFKVDYDTENELKAKYWVKIQNTIVILDNNGWRAKSKSGITRLNRILILF